jgi:hypothetical protein
MARLDRRFQTRAFPAIVPEPDFERLLSLPGKLVDYRNRPVTSPSFLPRPADA